VRLRLLAALQRGRLSQPRLLEWAALVGLIAILAGVLVQRVWALRVDAERVAMATVLANLRQAIGIELGLRAARDGLRSVGELDGADPMDLLPKPPMNYRGALAHPDPARIDGYQWYFETGSRTLVYRVANAQAFDTPLPGPARARFRLKLRYGDRNGNGRFDYGIDELQGLNLVPLERYHWRKAQ
jgi:hypothetical protein